MKRCRSCTPVPEEVRRAADLLERRWQLSVLFAALSGAVRFNEFAGAVSGISSRMLAERLRDLEQAGLLEREVIPSSPPVVEYRLTASGRALRPVIEALRAYAGAGRGEGAGSSGSTAGTGSAGSTAGSD